MNGPAEPQVESARVRMRLMATADLEWLYRSALDPSQAWRWRYGGATPAREQFVQLLYEGVACQYVVEQRSTGAPFGHVSLYGLHSQGHAKLAAMKDPTFGDRGLMMEAVALFVNYAFRVFPLRKLYAQCPEYTYRDIASGLGRYFREEGRFVEHEFYAGRYWDLVTLALTRQEWNDLLRRRSRLLGLAPPDTGTDTSTSTSTSSETDPNPAQTTEVRPTWQPA